MHHGEHAHGLHLRVLGVDDLEGHVSGHTTNKHTSRHTGLCGFFALLLLLLLKEFFFLDFSFEDSFFIILVLILKLPGFIPGGILNLFGINACMMYLIFPNIRLLISFPDLFLRQ